MRDTTPAAVRFTGIPAEAFEFYDGLAADPTKPWWEAHKQDYIANVRGPLLALGEELGPEFGEPHLFRPYRDVRFSKDKTPYKDHQGMYVDRGDGLGWYVQVSGRGLMVAGGWYQSTPSQVARYRAAVADDAGAAALSLVLEDARSAGLEVSGERLKSRPRGYPEDHPHIRLLRYRTLYLQRTWEPSAWMGTRRAVGRVRTEWETIRPLLDWFSGVLGPGDPRPRTGGQDGL